VTLIYFSYSFVHHLEGPVLDEQGLSIHLTNDLLMSSVFVHKLEACVLHEHNPLIPLNRHVEHESVCMTTLV
jgi:hypothetical protein